MDRYYNLSSILIAAAIIIWIILAIIALVMYWTDIRNERKSSI